MTSSLLAFSRTARPRPADLLKCEHSLSPYPTFALNSGDIIIAWNKACEEKLGHEAQETLGWPFNTLLTKGQNRRWRAIKSLLRTRPSWEGRISLRSKKGAPVELPLRIVPFSWREGSCAGLLAFGAGAEPPAAGPS